MLLEKLFSGLIKNSSIQKKEKVETQENVHSESEKIRPVITIAREFGSGG